MMHADRGYADLHDHFDRLDAGFDAGPYLTATIEETRDDD
jgi:hypothetical protein